MFIYKHIQVPLYILWHIDTSVTCISRHILLLSFSPSLLPFFLPPSLLPSLHHFLGKKRNCMFYFCKYINKIMVSQLFYLVLVLWKSVRIIEMTFATYVNFSMKNPGESVYKKDNRNRIKNEAIILLVIFSWHIYGELVENTVAWVTYHKPSSFVFSELGTLS